MRAIRFLTPLVLITLLVGAGFAPSAQAGPRAREFPIPTAFSRPWGIAAGPDGNLWFAESGEFANNIAGITHQGVITEFPTPTDYSFPMGITAGPDGDLWFTEYGGNRIGRITAQGVITEFPLPAANSQPWGITAGPDGNVWFTEFGQQDRADHGGGSHHRVPHP
jgi:virginiamycin B lyase